MALVYRTVSVAAIQSGNWECDKKFTLHIWDGPQNILNLYLEINVKKLPV